QRRTSRVVPCCWQEDGPFLVASDTPRNPAALLFPPRPRRREMTALTVDQLLALFAATQGDRLHVLWVLLATAGLRVGEALGLKWEDVDLDARRLTVKRALQQRRAVGLVFVEPKTPRSRRAV